MTDAVGADDATVTFHIKSSGGQKYTLTLPLSTTAADLKNKLATEEYANVPASAQRLIYSGKVLKDHETLASHNVKDGNTMHLVKSAASNQRQNPAAQSSSPLNSASTAVPPATGVPQNLASGTGNDPLAGLTGARYAGFAQLPDASMFQNPQSPEDFLRQLEDPNFQQIMREAMNNPQVIDMMINQSPHLRAMGPQVRRMLQSDYFRRVMTDPQALRSMLQMQQALGMNPFGGAGGDGAFPAPGVTNTTEGGNSESASTSPQSLPRQPGAFGQGAGGNNVPANPFAVLFGAPPPGQNQTAPTPNPTSPNNGTSQTEGTNTNIQNQQQPPQQAQQRNPFEALFNPALFPAPDQRNPFDAQNNPFAANPDGMQRLFQAMEAMGAGNQPPYYDNLFGNDLFGAGAPDPPPDNRPPEERYANQLQQLNEMGFYDFDRNIQALRRTGGSVNGAIEYLLNNP
ncbi:uncharacterized protein Z518_02404 [Rhinocladiella mackenziei CBS 650.93]|uniref:Ubiquitin-like protein DskB n=1 Tax=Rhinocladiella mackenziei CBS 650.93 TaxID=1442369 RepID=A0A0D2JEX8_9EURO|nr:uncharacterized protein Z518_02404 [Rhinocladiella mackenziei CBS 650.93]KIX07750.1 hypothetical protein Z518_02404 [Rhinocladiella mackenziei CBS 650.93]